MKGCIPKRIHFIQCRAETNVLVSIFLKRIAYKYRPILRNGYQVLDWLRILRLKSKSFFQSIEISFNTAYRFLSLDKGIYRFQLICEINRLAVMYRSGFWGKSHGEKLHTRQIVG